MRRLTLRAVGLLAIALSAITCTDATTAPGARRLAAARLGMAPSLSPAATRANAVLADAGITVTQVHILLRTTEGATAKDTVISFPATQDTLHVEIPLQILGTEQSFTAQLDLLDVNGIALFSHTQVVTARASTLPGAPPPAIVLEYVGPGATARAVAIAPTDLTLNPGTPLPLVATATDSAGHTLPDLIVAWTSSDTSIAKVLSTGRSAATVTGTGRRGSVTITATTPTGVVGTAHLSLLPLATKLVVVSGDAQTGAAGRPLAQPLVLELQGLDGLPIANAAVAVSPVTAGAVVGASAGDTLFTTDAQGRVSATLTVGQTTGAYVFQARAGTLLAPAISATATAGAAAKLAFAQAPADTVVVGTTFAPITARLTDAFGNAVHIAGVKVMIHGQGPDSGSYNDSTLTDTAGIAAVTLGRYNGTAGRLTLTLTSAGLDSLVRGITAVAGTAAELRVVSGVPAAAASGVAFAQPVVVQVTDVGGNAVAASIAITASTIGGGTLSGTTTVTTSADGRATFGALTLSGVAGSYALRFDAAGLTGVNSSAIALSGGVATTLTITGGTGQTGASASTLALPLSVRVTDTNGNPVRGGHVIFSATHGGHASPDTALVDASGSASAQWTVGSAAGQDTLVARLDSTTVAPVTFTATVTAGAAARFQLAVSSLTPVAGQPVTVQAQLLDASNNPVRVAGHVATWSASVTGGTFASATSATDANGLAQVTYTTPTAAGTSVVLTATESAASGSSAPVVTQTGTGSMLGFAGGWLVSGTTANGAAFVPQPVVQLLDANGNAVRVVGVVVTAAVSSGPGSPALAGATATTDVNGHATFSGLAITGLAGDYTLSFAAPSYTPLPSATLHVGAGAPVALAFGTEPPASTAATAPFGFTVHLVDASGNVATGASDSVSVMIASGTGHTGASLRDAGLPVAQVTRAAVAGVVSFAGISIDSAGAAYALSAKFAAGPAATATSTAFDITVGSATHLTITGTQATSAPSGATLAPQPVVQLRDAGGNAVASAGVQVTASVSSGAATLSNATATTDATGAAHFTALAVSGAVGTVTLSFDAPAVTGVVSAPIAVTGGAPGQLALQTLPSATVASGVALAQQPVVQLRDAAGNSSATPGVSVSVSLSGGSATLGGTTTATSDALGRVDFTNLSITGAAGSYTLTFSSSGLASATAPVAVTAGAPATLVAIAGDGQSGGAGGLAPVAPVALVKDASGNPVAGASVVFTALSVGDSLLNGTVFVRSVTVVTSATGEATVGGWKFGTAGYDTVTATLGALKATFAATSSVGAATHFVVISGDKQSGTVTDSLPQLVVVEARDANEQPVPNVPAVFNYNYETDQGFIRVVGVNYNCDCYVTDSVNTDSTGRASFAWQLSYHAKVDSVYVENADIPATLMTATAKVGPAEFLVFNAPSGLDDDAGNTLNPFQVYFTDRGGYDTVSVNAPVTLALSHPPISCDGTCPTPPTPGGTLTVNAVNGVATFSDVSIASAGTYLFTATSGSLSGGSDWFDISPAGPHFVLVSPQPIPTTTVAGTALTIQLRSQDAHGNPLPNTTVMVSRGDFNGSVSLTAGSSRGYSDSSTTDINGLTTLTWVMPSQPLDNLTITVYNYETAQPLYLTTSAVIGPPVKLMVESEGGLDDDVNNTLNGVQVRVTDAGGNTISTATGSVTMTLTGGDAQARLSGTTTLPLDGGVAYFSDLAIDKSGLSYRLHAATDDGKFVGLSTEFDISDPASAALYGIEPTTGTALLMKPSSTGTVSIRAFDEAHSPVANQHILLTSYDATRCWFGAPGTDHIGAFTDASGIATFSVGSGSVNGGCQLSASTVLASGSNIATNLQGAVYQGPATHVWVGNPLNPAFEADSNWVRTSDYSTLAVPTSGDRIFVPANVWSYPVMERGNQSLAGVEIQQGSGLGLGGYTLTVTGDVSAASASLSGGTLIVRGVGSTVTGYVDTLQVGVAGCSGDDVTVRDVQSSKLRVVCRATTTGSTYASDSLVVLPAAKLKLAGTGSSMVVGNAWVEGDSLAVDGQLMVYGAGVLKPNALVMASTSQLYVYGNAVLGTGGTSKLALAGELYFGGSLSEEGTGTSVASNISVQGDVLFDGGDFTLPSGVLAVAGNFSTGSSHTQKAFVASGDHVTHFNGSALQNVSVVYNSPGASEFAKVVIENTGTGVDFLTGATLVGGTDPTRLELLGYASLKVDGGMTIAGGAVLDHDAKLTITAPMTLTGGGTLLLGATTFFQVNAAFTGPCSYLASSPPNVFGTGTINGGSPSTASCTPQ